MKKIRFLLNPKAGHGNSRKLNSLIPGFYHSTQHHIEIVQTEFAGHAHELAKDAAEKNFFAVVAAGGDGTVNEVAGALAGSGTALGIIPSGSGNGFARHFGIPMNVKDALAITDTGKIITTDSLLVNQKFCINMAGTGFDAHIARLFASFGKRGLASYVRLVKREYFSYPERNFEIEMDGTIINRKALVIEAANGSQFGNGARIASLARVDDGMADLVVLRKISLAAMLPVLIKLFNGSLHRSANVETLKGKKIVIKSNEPMELHVDGEPAGNHEKIEIIIREKTNLLIVPQKFSLA